MERVVLLDMGNTLVRYYARAEWPGIRDRAIAGVAGLLRERGLLTVSPEAVREGVRREDTPPPDHSVMPLEERLGRIFDLDGEDAALREAVCRRFLEPVFAVGWVYDDVPPALRRLRLASRRTCIVSNTPWGSPAGLWREELARLGLAELVDEMAFCRDVGWRKPDERIFRHVLTLMDARPEECIFVGDDPRWDVVGPRRVGIRPVLIDRRGEADECGVPTIRSLSELWDVMPHLDGQRKGIR